MHEPMRIEVPDGRRAAQLRRHLQRFDLETFVHEDGKCEVLVQLVEANPERRVVAALNAIDDWLVGSDVPAVRVHVDGTAYTLHSTPPGP
jgi:hypothetical protein